MNLSRNNIISVLIISLLLVEACSPAVVEVKEEVSSPVPTISDWYELFFTDPGSPQALSWMGGPDETLAEAIHQARLSVDVAIYEFNSWKIESALSDAHWRGIQVRIVIESDNLDSPEIQRLKEQGIPVLDDRREGLMHNKFVVIDHLDVWIGSLNFTLNGAYRNNENLIHIRSLQLAQDYLAEFNEMFLDDQFGAGSPAKTPFPKVSINGVLIEVYFSPEDGTLRRLKELISNAQESIYFLSYSFTSDELAELILNKAQNGVRVMGVLDESQYHTNFDSEFDIFKMEELDVHLDGNPYRMHHKVIIIDEQIAVTGSYNFSHAAESNNDENTLVIHDAQIAAQYLQEFEKVYREAQR